MKKHIILLLFLFPAIKGNSQLTDTLLWLKTHIQSNNSYFTGRPFHNVLDSLYSLKAGLIEYSSPLDIEQFSDEKRWGKAADKDTLFIKELWCYFASITGGNRVAQLHEKNTWDNFSHNRNDVINTHVPFIKIVFKKPVPFLKSCCGDGLCDRKWNSFAEKYFGDFLVDEVSVGEY